MSSKAACFMAGPNGDVLVKASIQACALVLEALRFPEEVHHSLHLAQVRAELETGIHVTRKEACGNLWCSVTLAPCFDGSKAHHVNYDCLRFLGPLGQPCGKLRRKVCLAHGTELPVERYKQWFYTHADCAHSHSGQASKDVLVRDEKKLRKVAQVVTNLNILQALGLELGVSLKQIDACYTNAHYNIEKAALSVLYDHWYLNVPGSLEPNGPKSDSLKRALQQANLSYYACPTFAE